MPAADQARLLALAEAVADGRPIDWAAESGSFAAHDRELLVQLQLLAGVGQVHRSGGTTTADAPAQPVDADAPPQYWGTLEIRERVGAGQFGTVYRAWDPHLEREVALKLLNRHAAEPSEGSTSTAVHEGRLLARVRHPHVISVFGADQIDGRIGVWMELVRGSTLQAVFRGHGTFGAQEAALIGVDLCGALAAVHREGLVHRDVKAQNIMREAGGRIVLMDFGAGEDVASRVREGRIAGTPLYMAPELLVAGAATPQSDIYSVGVLLFWLVTGVYPVAGRTTAQLQLAHATGERRRLRDERPDLPSSFVATVERALAHDPAERYASAGVLEEALREFVSARPASSGEVVEAAGADRAATSRWGLRHAFFALALAVVLIATVWRFGGHLVSDRPPARAPLTGIRSVAVVPFTNVSGDPNNDYFAAGLADLLVSRLGSIKALRVVTDSSKAGARAGNGSGLNVEGIITGSVDRRGTQLRVNARLLQAGTNALLWSDSYERTVDEAFALQGLIARDIAREVRVSLSDEERTRLNQAYRPDPRAQDGYLRARVLMHRQERAALEEARKLLEKAIELDAGYQLAFAALARCYVSLQEVGALGPAEGAALARKAAKAALAIDDNADAQLALAHVSFTSDWNWAAAESAFRRALDLNPSFSEARNRFSKFLSAAGRTQESLEEARRGLQLDPLSLEMHEALAMALYYDRKYKEALDTIASIAAVGEQSPTLLGRIHSALGDQSAALRYISAGYTRTRNPALLAERGRLEALMGRRDRASAIVAELRHLRETGNSYLFPGDIAFVLIALGSTDEALQALEVAVQERASRVLWLRVDPRVDAIRSHARFQKLLRRIGP
jgi:eukaryotic-like serine/threonine-protein kinase